jgi:hypothetical protein
MCAGLIRDDIKLSTRIETLDITTKGHTRDIKAHGELIDRLVDMIRKVQDLKTSAAPVPAPVTTTTSTTTNAEVTQLLHDITGVKKAIQDHRIRLVAGLKDRRVVNIGANEMFESSTKNLAEDDLEGWVLAYSKVVNYELGHLTRNLHEVSKRATVPRNQAGYR